MNLKVEVEKVKGTGYTEALAESRLCQDLLLKAISESEYCQNVTIKGGVVMRNLSNDDRRATRDLDFDFIKYSIDDAAVIKFLQHINVIEGIRFNVVDKITELKHHDYRGKRVNLIISDDYGNELLSKVDIGVHNKLDIGQKNFSFDVCFQEDSISLLANSVEQMFVEKLISLLRFGTRSTRYKDVFDMYYLLNYVEITKLRKCFLIEILENNSLAISSLSEITDRLERIKADELYLKRLEMSPQNWLNDSSSVALNSIVSFLQDM